MSRRLGLGAGSTVGGRAILAVDPVALRRLGRGRRSALVSGTNGKTTTTSLLAAALATVGPVVTNLQGANLPFGIAAALAEGASTSDAVLEVDEAWLARVAAALDPEVVVLLNLSRDQLDRNSEVRVLASSWRDLLRAHSGTVVANADDPLVAWAAGSAARVVWVGAGQPWTADAAGCPSCGGRVVFPGAAAAPLSSVQAPGTGWSCSSCELRRPVLDVRLGTDEVIGRDGRRVALRLGLPGRANRANAAMALTAAGALGVDAGEAASAMAGVEEIAGRYRAFRVGEAAARLLLAKNPAGWLEVLDVLRPAPAPVVVAINARIADGRDPSWLWDVPFEALVGRPVIATGERGRDLAVRLRYAEVDHRYAGDLREAVGVAARLAVATPGEAGGSPTPRRAPEFDVVANYSAFQALLARLA
jgi:UDP-N-acetylmuramyl tripeptide synthase